MMTDAPGVVEAKECVDSLHCRSGRVVLMAVLHVDLSH